MDICANCDTPFVRHYSKKGKRQIFCCRKCVWAAKHRVVLSCKACGKSFEVYHLKKNREYCSRECIERSPCVVCGNIILGRENMNGRPRRFCSRRCASIFNSLLKVGSKTYRLRCFAYTIIKLGTLACERCGIDDIWTLHAHHINGRNAGDGASNLITLCANCHEREHRQDSPTRKRDFERARTLAPLLATMLAADENNKVAQPSLLLPMPHNFKGRAATVRARREQLAFDA